MTTAVEKYIDIITDILASKCQECIKNKIVKNYIILANATLTDEKFQHFKGWRPMLVMNAHGFIEVHHVIANGIPFLDSIQVVKQELIDIANISEEQFEIPYDIINNHLPSAEDIDIWLK